MYFTTIFKNCNAFEEDFISEKKNAAGTQFCFQISTPGQFLLLCNIRHIANTVHRVQRAMGKTV